MANPREPNIVTVADRIFDSRLVSPASGHYGRVPNALAKE